MRPDQTVSTLWTTNSSCTTRQTMPTMVVCNTWREKCLIPPRGLISWITTIQKLLFSGHWSILSFVDIPTEVTAYLRINRPHLPCYEIMDPFISTSQSSVSGILRNVLLNISLLNLTEAFLSFGLSYKYHVTAWTLLPYVSCRLCWKGTLWDTDLSWQSL